MYITIKVVLLPAINGSINRTHDTIPIRRSPQHKLPKTAFDGVCNDHFFTSAVRNSPLRKMIIIEKIERRE